MDRSFFTIIKGTFAFQKINIHFRKFKNQMLFRQNIVFFGEMRMFLHHINGIEFEIIQISGEI